MFIEPSEVLTIITNVALPRSIIITPLHAHECNTSQWWSHLGRREQGGREQVGREQGGSFMGGVYLQNIPMSATLKSYLHQL